MTELIKRMCLAAAATVAVGALAEPAWSVRPEFELEVDVVSKYVWRGQLLTDDPVMQPGVTVSHSGLSLNVWASIDLTGANELNDKAYRIQEVNYTLSYAFEPADGLELAAGVIVYDFPGTGFPTTTEIFGEAALSRLPLNPTLAVYYDVDEVEGWYLNLSLGHEFEVTEQLSVALGAGLGYGDSDYNDAYFGVNGASFQDLALTAGLTYAPNEMVAFSLVTGYSKLIDGDVQDAVDDSDVFTAGLNVTLTF